MIDHYIAPAIGHLRLRSLRIEHLDRLCIDLLAPAPDGPTDSHPRPSTTSRSSAAQRSTTPTTKRPLSETANSTASTAPEPTPVPPSEPSATSANTSLSKPAVRGSTSPTASLTAPGARNQPPPDRTRHGRGPPRPRRLPRCRHLSTRPLDELRAMRQDATDALQPAPTSADVVRNQVAAADAEVRRLTNRSRAARAQHLALTTVPRTSHDRIEAARCTEREAATDLAEGEAAPPRHPHPRISCERRHCRGRALPWHDRRRHRPQGHQRRPKPRSIPHHRPRSTTTPQ